MSIFAVTAIAILVSAAMALGRAILGPTSYDRILAVNAIGTKTVLLIAVLGFMNGRPDFLDLALVYSLVNFVGTLAVLKYFKFGTLRGGLSGTRKRGN
ncbi:monovalent cation/H+ antiporter complex subunit F [Sneathiella chinensis]|uniref:PH regulation protein F n=1 Tax=Sneathiella chinensis TaxID=349750 RepID=A0ABQ5U4M7_9PROT|nr:monovalent cation/H+ antiporter complex subunit F [Sneathiella chinensis]GLQ07099.1 pH regulation protein F [Sneathiella chinensis]